MIKISLSAVFVVLLGFTNYCHAAQPLVAQDGMQPVTTTPMQLITVKAKAPFDNLRLRVIMRFPANVKNIQQATQYLLEATNYKLVLNPDSPDEARRILSRPLLAQDRDDSLKTIEDALLQIAGEDTVLVIDRSNRLISFEFMEGMSE